MHATVLCLATVTLGVDVGWRPLPEGGMEYIIQIEPHMLPMLAKGQEVFSDIPPNLRGVRSYRITVGTDELPREGEMEREPAASPLLTPPRYGEPAPTPGSEASRSASLPWDPPRALRPPTDTRPLPESGEKPALFIDQEQQPPSPSAAEPERQEEAAGSGKAQGPEKPWGPFTLALAGFFGSFGGMLYTGWLAWGYRRQYRSLLERMIDAGHRPTDQCEAVQAEAGHLPGLPLGEEDEPMEL